MARRLLKHHQEDVRAKIKIGNILDRLEKHVNGKIELSQTQVASARILLDKTVSNAPTEIAAKMDAELAITVKNFILPSAH